MDKIESLDICIDFDGTCVTHDYPRIGKDIRAVPVLMRLIEAGHKIILYTMRSDLDHFQGKHMHDRRSNTNYLTQAKMWFERNGIPLYGVNVNPKQRSWTSSPKCYAQIYIDDAALGCPVIYDESVSDRPFVDWNAVESILEERGII